MTAMIGSKFNAAAPEACTTIVHQARGGKGDVPTRRVTQVTVQWRTGCNACGYTDIHSSRSSTPPRTGPRQLLGGSAPVQFNRVRLTSRASGAVDAAPFF